MPEPRRLLGQVAGIGLEGEADSDDVPGFDGPVLGEAFAVGSIAPEHGAAIGFFDVGDGAWGGLAIVATRGTYFKGVSFFGGEAGLLIANSSGRLLNNGTWFFDFGGNSLVEKDLSFAIHGPACIPI